MRTSKLTQITYLEGPSVPSQRVSQSTLIDFNLTQLTVNRDSSPSELNVQPLPISKKFERIRVEEDFKEKSDNDELQYSENEEQERTQVRQSFKVIRFDNSRSDAVPLMKSNCNNFSLSDPNFKNNKSLSKKPLYRPDCEQQSVQNQNSSKHSLLKTRVRSERLENYQKQNYPQVVKAKAQKIIDFKVPSKLSIRQIALNRQIRDNSSACLQGHQTREG